MSYSPAKNWAFRNLVAAVLAGDWVEDRVVARAGKAAGKTHRFLRPFVRRVLAAFPDPPDFDTLVRFAAADRELVAALENVTLQAARIFVVRPRMAPHPAAAGWAVPPLPSVDAVADWLRLDRAALDWFADPTGRTARAASLQLVHYRHAWVAKSDGNFRLLEAPKETLKRLQRKVLAGILDAVPPHAAAHGFRAGRSVVTNASPHCGRAVVLRFDLTAFFSTVSAGRVFGIFRTLGYPAVVAWVLTGLCTTRTPRTVWDARPNAHSGGDHSDWLRLAGRHLPQGAPTSPALANLAAYGLDARLTALADSLDATYTRYADDLTFSGGPDLSAAAVRFGAAVGRVAADEGFAVNGGKTRILRRGSRQIVAGVVVNVRPNVPRAVFDELKAILTNCVRHGPASQNRAAHPDFRRHLAGRVAHVANVNPARGRKLWRLFDRVRWPGEPGPGKPVTADPSR